LPKLVNFESGVVAELWQADPLDEAVEWVQSRKRTWETRIDRLDGHLRQKGEEDG